ncbi:SSU ribosomal protein S1p [Caballeronia sordidicola]|uniref:SSU ribosomal protein S1p n=1 Tax=Caballeronia sordidicola TaxID=196367 RepID=A0A242MPR0_CABSO|nr:SSU ribosomal protein S1p [Caballeronia sordidicola]
MFRAGKREVAAQL